jgi:hypothetical protein
VNAAGITVQTLVQIQRIQQFACAALRMWMARVNCASSPKYHSRLFKGRDNFYSAFFQEGEDLLSNKDGRAEKQ